MVEKNLNMPVFPKTPYDEHYYALITKDYVSFTPFAILRMKQILKMVQPKPEDRILDLGCATGSTSHFCGKFGADVTGIDLSRLAIQKAKELYKNYKNLYFLICDVADLSVFEDEYFDKAVATDLVEHLYQDVFEKMIQETSRVLKKGGTLSIYTPCKTHIIERLKAKNFILKQFPEHVSVKSMKEIISPLKAYGFKVDTAYFTISPFPFFKYVELLMQPIPLLGDLFKYRICVRGAKT